jgi:glycosyltransferase involved in cell wall biosynthesis
LGEGLRALGVETDVATTPAALGNLLGRRQHGGILMQHEYGLYYFNLIAMLNQADRSGLPFIITVHNSDHRGWMGAQHLFLFKSRAKFVVHSLITRDNLLRAQASLDASRLTTIPMGSPDFRDQFGPVEDVRREMGLPPGGFVVGFFGFAANHKGISNLVKALLLLPDVTGYISASIHPVNPGAVAGIYEEGGLTRPPGERGVHGNVTISHKWIPEEEFGRYQNAMDVIVLPYSMHGESVSTSMMAHVVLACGRPTIVTAVPYFADLGDTVLTIPDNQPETIAAAVEVLRKDPGLRESLAARAASYAAEHAWPRVAQSYLDLL